MIGYNFIGGGVQKLFAQLDCGAQQGTPAGQKYFENPPPCNIRRLYSDNFVKT